MAAREKTKSELIRGINKLRVAYRVLSSAMVSSGYLPNKELIFHLTHKEIRQVMKERDASIISKYVHNLMYSIISPLTTICYRRHDCYLVLSIEIIQDEVTKILLIKS